MISAFRWVRRDCAIQPSTASWSSRLAVGVWLAAVMALLASACSSSSDDDHAKPAAPVALANFCAQWAAAVCTGIQNCCTDTARKYVDVATCNAMQAERCNSDYFPALSGGQYTYDAAAAGEIVARVSRSNSACAEPDGQISLTSLVGPALPPGAPCRLFTGMIAANPCVGSYCKPAADGTSSSCALTPAQGEPCPDLICASGLACIRLPNASAATCEPVAAGNGTSCSGQTAKCPLGQVCRYSDAGIAGFFKNGTYPTTYQCLPQLGNGAQTLEPYTCSSGLMRLGETSINCVACTSSNDCAQPSTNTGTVQLISIDTYSGYCDAGACHDGMNNPPLGSKPKDAVCFSDAECRSQSCPKVAQSLGHCGAPNVNQLFCGAPTAI